MLILAWAVFPTIGIIIEIVLLISQRSVDDCAGAFLCLAADALSAYVTGQTIKVNGSQPMP